MKKLIKRHRKQIDWKKLLYWVIVLGFFYFISQQLTEIENVMGALTQGRPLYILLAIIFEALFYFFTAQFSIKLLNFCDIHIAFRKMLSFFTTSAFLNVTAPGGGLGGLIYQIQKVAKDTNSASGRVFIALVMVTMNMYWSFMILAFVSMWFLISHGMQYATMFTAVMIFMLISAITLGIFYLIRDYPSKLLAFMRHFKFLDRLFRKLVKRFDGEGSDLWIESRIAEMHDTARKISAERHYWSLMFTSGMMLHLIQATILFYVMNAFNISFNPSLLVVGYTSLYLFSVVSPTPQGIGIAEGLSQLVFVAFGVPSEKAILAVLAFRAITVWIPLMIGFVNFRLSTRAKSNINQG